MAATLALMLPSSAMGDAPNGTVGVVSAFAGIQGTAGDADGFRTNATFWDIQGITSDANNLYLGVYKDNGLPADSEGWIRKIDMDTGQVSTLVDQTGFVPRKLAYADGELYVASPADTTLQRVHLSTDPVTMSSFGPTLQSAEAIATDGTNLYVTEMGPECGGSSPDGPKITKIPIADPDNSETLATFPRAEAQPACNTLYELVYDNGSLYTTDRSTLYKVDPTTGETSVVLSECSPGSQLDYPYGLAALNGVIYISCSQAGGELWAVNPTTGEKFPAFAGTDGTSADPAMGIGADVGWHPAAMAPFDGKLYIADRLDYDPAPGGLGWAHHILRQAEILPDAASPTGTATATATDGSAPALRRASATYALQISATDRKTGRIPSGVRWYQIGQHQTPSGGWRPYTRSATLALPAGAQIRFRDRAFNVSPWKAVKFPDNTPPQTTIVSGPSGQTRDTSPTFKFTSNEANSHFQCRLDGTAFRACTSPKGLANVARGQHVFRVRAIDPAGNIDPTPAARQFTVTP